jgi:hypothetical protein
MLTATSWNSRSELCLAFSNGEELSDVSVRQPKE